MSDSGNSRGLLIVVAVGVVLAGVAIWSMGSGSGKADAEAFGSPGGGKPAPVVQEASGSKPRPLIKKDMHVREKDGAASGPAPTDPGVSPAPGGAAAKPKGRSRLQAMPGSNQR